MLIFTNLHIFLTDEEPRRKKSRGVTYGMHEDSFVDEEHMVVPDPSLTGAKAVCRLTDHAK